MKKIQVQLKFQNRKDIRKSRTNCSIIPQPLTVSENKFCNLLASNMLCLFQISIPNTCHLEIFNSHFACNIKKNSCIHSVMPAWWSLHTHLFSICMLYVTDISTDFHSFSSAWLIYSARQHDRVLPQCAYKVLQNYTMHSSFEWFNCSLAEHISSWILLYNHWDTHSISKISDQASSWPTIGPLPHKSQHMVAIKPPNFDNLCSDGIIYTKDEWPLDRIARVWQSICMTVARIQDGEDKRLWGIFAGV